VISVSGSAVAQRNEQQLRFNHVTVEDGLSDSWVFCVVKDSQGFVWFGTANGLDRFDGVSMKSYRYQPDNPRGLGSPRVKSLFEDSENRLWVGSAWYGSGLARYDRATDSFVNYPVEGPNGLGAKGVNAILEDSHGILWLGTDEGLHTLDAATGVFSLHQVGGEDRPGGSVNALFEDHAGSLWIGTGTGLLRREPGTGAATVIPLGGVGKHDPLPEVLDICEDRAGGLWVATLGEGLCRLEVSTVTVRRYLPRAGDPSSLGNRNVTQVEMGADGVLYVGTENGGLNLLDIERDRFTRYLPDVEDATSISSASIWSVLRDDQGIVWIGTFNGGVNVINPLGQRFGLLHAGSGGLSDPHVTAVLEDHRGVLWIGTDGGGLNRLDRRTGKISCYRHDSRDAASLASDAVIMLHEDTQRRLWVGTWHGGLGLLERDTGRFTHHRHETGDETSLANDSPWCVFEQAANRFLIGTEGSGVEVFDPTTGAFTRFADDAPGLPADGYVHEIAQDRRGTLWMALAQGVGMRAAGADRVLLLTHDPDNAESVGRGPVRCVTVDSRDNAWFGSEGGGLSCHVAGGTAQVFRRFTSRQGLPGDSVFAILEDAQGNLWLGTNRGLSCFRDAVELPGEPHFVNFDPQDGLQGLEFRYGASFASPQGELFFGGQRGLNFFYPENVVQNPDPPPIVLTGLQLFNQPVVVGGTGSVLPRQLSQLRQLTLSPRDSVVTFEYAALNFILPQKNQYAYLLEGFDREWNRVGTQRRATYTNLPPGDYVFRVKGSNNDGVWNEHGAALRVRVLPPYYRTVWFRTLVGGLLVLGLMVAYSTRVRFLTRRKRELEQRVSQRTHALEQEIDERLRAEEALKRSEERYALAARGTDDGIWDWDLSSNQVYYSPRFKEILGFGGAEITPDPEQWLGRVHPEDAQRLRDKLDAFCQGKEPQLEDEHRLRHKDGSFRWVLSRCFAVRSPQGACHRLVGALSDITDRRVYDPLTGLPNRVLLTERLRYAMADGSDDLPIIAVMLIDLDRFKLVNDSYGHLAGDTLLVAVSQRIAKCLRPRDLVARFGGDEFAVVVHDVDGSEAAVGLARRIQEALLEPFELNAAEVFVAASVGIAVSGPEYENPQDLLRDAGTALHQTKAEGRHRIAVFDLAMRAAAYKSLHLENALRRALKERTLQVFYQPIVSLQNGQIMGFEALSRWHHPVRGWIQPAEFIRLAEETGQMTQLSRQVLTTACQQLSRWQSECERARSLFVSVNVSPRQLTRPELIREIKAAMRGAGLPPRSLRIEITEDVLLEGDDRVLRALQRLRRLRVGIDVDDFGSGYSSLRYLQQLPMDALKIDRMFIHQLGASQSSQVIVKTILSLASQLELAVIAEGVETQEQYLQLKQLGCHWAQGYFISYPVEAQKARALLDLAPFDQETGGTEQ